MSMGVGILTTPIPAISPTERRPRSTFSRSPLRLVADFDAHPRADEPGVDAPLEKLSDGFAATRSVVERPVIYIHADERVGFGAVESSGKFHRMVESCAPMLQAVRDTVVQMA